jgi:hypothetical protein
VPHVRLSVRGPKMMGEAQRLLSLHQTPKGSAVRPSDFPNAGAKAQSFHADSLAPATAKSAQNPNGKSVGSFRLYGMTKVVP